jgi:hypothetical protein
MANGLRGVAKTRLRKTLKLYTVLIFWFFLIMQKEQEYKTTLFDRRKVSKKSAH